MFFAIVSLLKPHLRASTQGCVLSTYSPFDFIGLTVKQAWNTSERRKIPRHRKARIVRLARPRPAG
jgi:hypothetical protein